MARHEHPTPGSAAMLAERVAAAIPVLRTDRLVLRAPRISDFSAYAEIACSERGRSITETPERAHAFFEFTQMAAGWLLHGHGAWAVEHDSEVMGFVLIGLEPGDREPELGFLFRAAGEGRGFAHEAAEAALAFAFGTLGLETLVSYIDPENARALRLAERLGGQRDGDAEAMFDFPISVVRHQSAAKGEP